MSLIANLLRPGHVLVDLEAGNKKKIFERISDVLAQSLGIAHSIILDSLLTREKLSSTGLGSGIAIPHGRVKGLKEATGVFARMKSPVPFDAYDGKPVKLIFAVLVPEHATEHHLQILAELAQMFSDETMRQSLANCETSAAAYELITKWSPYAPGQRSAAI